MVDERLLDTGPSPVVALNRGRCDQLREWSSGRPAALERLRDQPQLSTYPYMAAARADCYRRLELCDEARAAFHEAVQLTEDLVEREYLPAPIRRLPNGTLDVTT